MGKPGAYLETARRENELRLASEAVRDFDDIVVELSRPLGFKRAKLSESLQNRLGVTVDAVFGSGQLYAPVFARYEKDKVTLYEA